MTVLELGPNGLIAIFTASKLRFNDFGPTSTVSELRPKGFGDGIRDVAGGGAAAPFKRKFSTTFSFEQGVL